MALDRSADVLYCSSFSKTLAPGYRIGWIAAGRRLQEVLERKCALTLCSPALPQVAMADFLSSGGYDSHLRRIRRVFQHNIAQTTRSIERTFPAATKVTRPAGGFVLWLALPRPCDSRTLFAAALEKGICFAPRDVFSASGRYRNCLRLSCASIWDARLEAGVATLGALASAQLARAA
jgi:DNA-binding transcriptional MocR family regulator